jgi:hypothetical protein
MTQQSLPVRIRNEGNAHHLLQDHCSLSVLSRPVSQAYYMEIMKWLQEVVCRKRPAFWPNNWILHRDNAQTHKALSFSLWPEK